MGTTIPAMYSDFKSALESALEKTGRSLRDVAAQSGVSYELLKKVSQGRTRSPNVDAAQAVANEFGASLDEFLAGRIGATAEVPVLGRVGAGAKVLIDGQGETALYTLPCPAQLGPDRLAAVEVEGDSMAPAIAPGSVLFYRRDHAEGAASEYLGRVCIVETADGHVWAKQLRTGTQPGLYHLISVNPAADNLLDRPLRWASPVLLVLPPELVGK